MPIPLVAVTCLALASVTANLSTERARPRLNPVLGWSLTIALLGAAIVALAQPLGKAEAVAVALAGLMIGIPCVSSWIGLRRRKDGRRGV